MIDNKASARLLVVGTRLIRRLFITFMVASVLLALASAVAVWRAPTTVTKTYGTSCQDCLDIREFDRNIKDLSLFRSLVTSTASSLLLAAIFGLALLEKQPKKRVPKRAVKK